MIMVRGYLKAALIPLLSLSLLLPAAPGYGADNVQREALKGTPPGFVWSKGAEKPKAVLLCLHELGLHSGVFDSLAQRMAENDITTYAIDWRGHGAWPKDSLKKEKDMIEAGLGDVEETLKKIKQDHPDTPVFLLGEAMGGTMAIKAAGSFPDLLDGAISSAPGGAHYNQTGMNMTVAKHLLGGADKAFPMGYKLIEMATPDPELREHFKKDPQVRNDLTPRELMQCQFFMWSSHKLAKKVKKAPVLIVQGQKDGESKPEGAEKVYNKLATTDKKLMKVDDGDHYVYENPKMSNKVFDTTLAWIDDHIVKK